MSLYGPGIRRTGSGWQVYLRRNGQFLSKHFAPQTPIWELKQWRKEQQARAVLRMPLDPKPGETFAADCAAYLRAVEGMTTYADRKYRIQQWEDTLGPNRRRSEIASVEIRQQLEVWKKDGLSHGTLNLRRTALMHLYTVLDGKGARNPVKDVPRYREDVLPLALPSLEDALKAIDAIPTASRSHARLRVLLWTGWPSSSLKRLRKSDVDWKQARVLLHGRQKGAGTRPRWLPLLPQAVAALKAFKKAKAWGQFSNASLRSRLHRGCDKAKVPRFRVYDLRHLFLTMVATTVKDDRVVAELAMHSDIRQTRRYTEQSVNPRLLAGMAKMAKALEPSDD